MATQDNNAQKTPDQSTSPRTQNTQGDRKETDDTTTGHTYDPVGMAGQKAGIVEELEQDLGPEGCEPKDSASSSVDANKKS